MALEFHQSPGNEFGALRYNPSLMQIIRGLTSPDNQPLALTIGNFDGVHLGHRALLEQLTRTARAEGLPAAVLTFEPHPREFFAPASAPARLTTLREKLELLAECGATQAMICPFNAAFAALSAPAAPAPSCSCRPRRSPRAR